MATVDPNPSGWRADVRTLVDGVKVQEAELPEEEEEEVVLPVAVHVSCPFFRSNLLCSSVFEHAVGSH